MLPREVQAEPEGGERGFPGSLGVVGEETWRRIFQEREQHVGGPE